MRSMTDEGPLPQPHFTPHPPRFARHLLPQGEKGSLIPIGLLYLIFDGRRIPRSTMIGLARRQRRNSVSAEAIIWRALRDRRGEGLKFRRQAPIGNYIADFICFEKRLIIEIDGLSHETTEQRLRDAERDNWFRREGFKILRLSNDLVIGAPDLAVQRIFEALN